MAERIFVSIASYRDPECQWTVKDLFAKAEDPARISVGICWQFDSAADGHCFVEPYAYPDKVRVIDVPCQESRGACWARSRVQNLWQGEDYVLQIDSHMRFVPGWDRLLISMARQTGASKPLISVYPPGYVPPEAITRNVYSLMAPTQFSKEGILCFRPLNFSIKEAPVVPVESFFVSAGFMFAPSALLQEVPYDPYLYFYGEEISLAVRAWTRGWDIFIPNAPVIYHFYNELAVTARRHKRSTHFDDHADSWSKRDRVSKARVAWLLCGEGGSSDDLVDIDRYGLGSERSIAAYEELAGVSFRERRIFRSCAERIVTNLARAGSKTRKEHIYFNFAINHLERGGNNEDAILHCEALLQETCSPDYRHRVLLGLAEMYRKSKSFEKQREVLFKAVQSFPARAEAYIALARSYMQKDRWIEALPFAHAAMVTQCPPGTTNAGEYSYLPHALAAVCYAKIGNQPDAAVEHARIALALGCSEIETMQRIVDAPHDHLGVDLWMYPGRAGTFEKHRKMDALPEAWVDWISNNRKGGISKDYLEKVMLNSGFRVSLIRAALAGDAGE